MSLPEKEKEIQKKEFKMEEHEKYDDLQSEETRGGGRYGKEKKKQTAKFFAGLFFGLLLSIVFFVFWRGYFSIRLPFAGIITVKMPTYGIWGDSASAIDQNEFSRKFEEIGYFIDREYYYEPHRDELLDAAMAGAYYKITSDDSYSQYYTKDELKSEMDTNSGTFVGIGVYVITSKENGGVEVVRPLKGGSAIEAGIREGDIIIEADGVNLCGMDLDTAVSDHIKGEEGTTVSIVILRGAETLEFTLERRKVDTESVYSSVIPMDGKKLGYIYISSFVKTTYPGFTAAVDRLQEEAVDGIVIDLRDNTGGDMNVCINMLDYLLPDRISTYSSEEMLPTNLGRTKLLTIRGKNAANNYCLYAEDGHEIHTPMVILVNKYSASASEIFAGVMKSYSYPICGTTTFGKGIVQTVRMLYDNSGIKYTSAEYILPDGSRIHNVGIEPDRQVEPSGELSENGADPNEPDPVKDNMLAEAIRVLGEKN